MSNLNNLTVGGFLGSDPEKHKFNNGDVVASVNVGIGRNVPPQGDDDEWTEETTWVQVKARGSRADQLMNYSKGDFINVAGPICEPEAWMGNDNQVRATSTMQAYQIFTAGKKNSEERSAEEIVDDVDVEDQEGIVPEEAKETSTEEEVTEVEI